MIQRITPDESVMQMAETGRLALTLPHSVTNEVLDNFRAQLRSVLTPDADTLVVDMNNAVLDGTAPEYVVSSMVQAKIISDKAQAAIQFQNVPSVILQKIRQLKMNTYLGIPTAAEQDTATT